MSHLFSQVPRAEIPRSAFDRSHGHKTTFSAGYLIPVYVDEALPGDTFRLNLTHFARLATPIVPIMDNLYLDSFFFAVPYRLVWGDWVRFNGEQNSPGDSTSFLVPTIMTSKTVTANTLQDYMGIPPGISGIVYNNLHMRAYNLIWNTWFRDENLQNPAHLDTGAGPDDPANYVLMKRGKRHDYFTSCLPWPQKGTAVTIPLGTEAPITSKTTGMSPPFSPGMMVGNINQNSAGTDAFNTASGANPANVQLGNPATIAAHAIWWPTNTDPIGYNYADLSNATSATINSLRQSFQIQKLYERDARGGTRYTEILRSHFGVVSPDARLQRPEYLGGGSQPITIKPIAQTSASGLTGGTTKQGNLAAMGVMTGSGGGFSKSFTEHCLIIGLVSARADLTYQQGTERMWFRQTRWDYYWPALAHIGEQAVLNQEIYTQGTSDDQKVFGYNERYAEYRYKPSRISGEYRSSYSTPLDMWHLSQNFGSLPMLNDTFIQETPPMSRIEAVTSAPDFTYDSYISLKCARPMPLYGVPGNIDRF